MTNRGEFAALAAVATLAAVSIRASKRQGLGQANVFYSSLSMVLPSSADLAEMVIADYNPRDFVSVFPDASQMKGRSVEVQTTDLGPVLIHPRKA